MAFTMKNMAYWKSKNKISPMKQPAGATRERKGIGEEVYMVGGDDKVYGEGTWVKSDQSREQKDAKIALAKQHIAEQNKAMETYKDDPEGWEKWSNETAKARTY